VILELFNSISIYRNLAAGGGIVCLFAVFVRFVLVLFSLFWRLKRHGSG